MLVNICVTLYKRKLVLCILEFICSVIWFISIVCIAVSMKWYGFHLLVCLSQHGPTAANLQQAGDIDQLLQQWHVVGECAQCHVVILCR